jgi:hypothetical protein
VRAAAAAAVALAGDKTSKAGAASAPLQASHASAQAVVRRDAQALLGQPVASLGGDLEATLRDLARSGPLNAPVPLRCTLEAGGGLREFEGTVHRVDGGVLLVEVELELLVLVRITISQDGLVFQLYHKHLQFMK